MNAGDFLQVNKSDFDSVIKEYSYVNKHSGFGVKCFYVDLDTNGPKMALFWDLLKNHIVKYVYPVELRKRKKDVYRLAASRFSEADNSGEIGELLLFLILEACFNAVQIKAAMPLKIRRQMHSPGADAIHIKSEGEKILVFYGESKVYKDNNAAISRAVESSKNLIANKKHFEDEVEFVQNNIVHFGYDDKIAEFLNPYSKENTDCEYHYPCLICFDSSAYEAFKQKDVPALELFMSKYTEEITGSAGKFNTELTNAAFLHKNFYLILLPFESVENLRVSFLKVLKS